MTKVCQLTCRTLAIVLLLLGIVLIVANIALIVIGIATFEIMNPAFRWVVAGSLFGWMFALALAGVLHLGADRWFAPPSPASRCRRCGYDLCGSLDSTCCPECGLNRYSDGEGA